MKIVFVTELPVIANAGGIEKVTSVLSDGFVREDHQVKCISLENGIDSAYSDLAREMDFPGRKAIIFQNVSSPILKMMERCSRVDAEKICVLHNRPFPIHSRERIAKRLLSPTGFKSRLLRRIAILWPAFFRVFYTRFDASNYKKAASLSDRFVLLSERFIPRFLELSRGIDPSKVTAIPNPAPFRPVSCELNKEKLILFAARLVNQQKNVEGFIDVWVELHKKHPDWHAVIAGDGPDRERLETYAAQKGAANLKFIGMCENMADFYSKARFFAMTSLYEGWPMVLTEAMAYGCIPVVMDSFEAVYDIIEDGENGFIVPFGDAGGMARRISCCIENGEEMKGVAANAIESVCRFSVEKICKRWMDLLAK